MIPAMAQWLVPIRVIDCCKPPPVARAVFRDIPISGRFDSNTVAEIGEECLGYVVVYNG